MNFDKDLQEEKKSLDLLDTLKIKTSEILEKDHAAGKGDIIIHTKYGKKNCELKNTLKLNTQFTDSVCIEIANTSNLNDCNGWFQKSCPDYICYTDPVNGVAIFYEWTIFKKTVLEWLNSKDCKLFANFEPKYNFPPFKTGAIICFVPLWFLKKCRPCIKEVKNENNEIFKKGEI